MARIRSIHPGLLTDEAYMALTVEQPLAIALYLGLLMESDDFGVFEWKPMTIKARILPAATTDVADLLQILIEHRFIARFDVEGRSLGAIRNFCRYQRPKKPSALHPRNQAVEEWVRTGEIRANSTITSEPVRNQSTTSEEIPPQMEDGGWRMEDGGDACAATRGDQKTTSQLELDCREIVDTEPVLLAQDFHVLEDLIEPGGVTEADIRVGVREAIEKRADRKKRYRSWASFVGWCRTAAQNRLAEMPRSKIASPGVRGDPTEPIVDFRNGCTAPYSSIGAQWAKRRWPPDWGPKPGEPGCMLPPDLVNQLTSTTDA